MNSTRLKWSLLLALILLVIFLRPERRHDDQIKSATNATASADLSTDRNAASTRLRPVHDENARAKAQGPFEHLFDQSQRGHRFLIGKEHDQKFRPDSDAASGLDLWLQNANGEERLVHPSVTSARFSPDGNRIAFTTSDAELQVEDVHGNRLANVAGVYGPSWSPNGTEVIYSKVGEGEDPLRPGSRQLTTLNLTQGETKGLTEGTFDDGRPEFNPSGEWVLFVSGARSGLASFWKVPANGGEAVQLTNLGLQEANDGFVPTPYAHTVWSADQHWFVYDFKAGEKQETWGLEFNQDGTVRQAAKLADGINPRLQPDGRTLVCEKSNEQGVTETVIASLP